MKIACLMPGVRERALHSLAIDARCRGPEPVPSARTSAEGCRLAKGKAVLTCLAMVLVAPATALAGAWYVAPTGSDSAAGTASQPFASIQRGIDAAGPGDTLTIGAGLYSVSRPVRIVGKHASADQPLAIVGDGMPTITGTDQRVPGVWHGLVEIADSSHVRVQGLAVENSSFFGFKVERSDHIDLIGNRSAVSLASGIYVGKSSAVRIEGNDVSRFCDRNQFGADGRTGCQEGISLATVDGFSVNQNLVHDAMQRPDVGPGGGEGIDIKNGCKNGVVEANSVWNLVQLGIYIDAGALGNSNIKVRANRVWHTYMGIVINSEQGGTVSNVEVSDNLIHDVGYDGILVDDLKKGKGGNGPRQQIRIFNNTIVSAGAKENKPPYCRRWSDPCLDAGIGIKVATINITGLDIRNNIILDAKTASMAIDPAVRNSSTIDRNLVWPRRPGTREFVGTNPIIADPLLVNPAVGDYRLRPGSPAIGAGAVGVPLTRDINGLQRPTTGPIDLGAFALPKN